MADPFLAEIRMFGFNYPPAYWAFCNGQDYPISQNSALFALISNTFGGDGRTSMAVPNLQDRAPMQPGYGPGLTTRYYGKLGGVSAVALTQEQIPTHSHEFQASKESESKSPAGMYVGKSRGSIYYDQTPESPTQLAIQAVNNTGQSYKHENRQPYLPLNFCICMNGTFPQRN